jgi:glucose/arabinose dehydrogenase/mono/diheme cytochrome c family protein
MKKYQKLALIELLLGLIIVGSCKNSSSGDNNDWISSDSSIIAAGKKLFNQNCSGCHQFLQDGIGPKLGGVTSKLPVEWLHRFIRNPKNVLSSGDKHADSLFKKYQTVMPAFDFLKNEDMDAIIAFINTSKFPRQLEEQDLSAILNPIPEKIKASNLVVDLREIAQFPPSTFDKKPPLTRITKLTFQPNTNNIFVNDLRGKLYKLKSGKISVYLDFSKVRSKFISEPGLATGFGSFAFHPRFSANGLLYTTHTELPRSGKSTYAYNDSIPVTLQWVLTEWKVSDPFSDTLTGSSRELLRLNMVAGAHGMQDISFNPLSEPGMKDFGLLYIGIGDGASVQLGYPFIPEESERIWGSIFRIDPLGHNSINRQYGIPSDNPYARDTKQKVKSEIYAYGFRNPHRLAWTKSGEMLTSHIGQANIEAIDLVEPGHNYGWPVREGNFLFNPYGNLNNIYPLPEDDSKYNITYPVAEFDHDEGNAVSGGYEYMGNGIPELKDKFLFGDIPNGRLFYINARNIKQGKQAIIKEWFITIDGVPTSLKTLSRSDRVDLHFGVGPKNELYILTKADGKVYLLQGATYKNN